MKAVTLCLLDCGASLHTYQLRTQVLLETCGYRGNHQLCHLLIAVTSAVSLPFCFATCKQFLLFPKSKSGLLKPVGQVESVSVAVLEEAFQSRPPSGPSQLCCWQLRDAQQGT